MLFNQTIQVKTATEAWEHWYKLLSEMKEKDSSRDGNVVGEIINAITVIEDPTRNFVQSDIRNLPIRYAIGELLWYNSKNPNLKAIQVFTNAWDRMSDDGKTVNSNYGYIIHEKYGFDQYEYCKSLLIGNPNSRQAVIHIKTPRNTFERPTKDLNCTVCLQFFVRGNKLYCTTYMRSNDIWMGFPYDVFQFTCIQIRMAMELGLEVGTYTHIAGSLHLYERDYNKAESKKVGTLNGSNQ